MSFSLWISRRLRLNGSAQGANATGVVIAVTGVALAVIIMEFTIAIVLGFKHQITERILGFDGTVWVLPEFDPNTALSAAAIEPDEELMTVINQILPGVKTEMRFAQPGILKTDNDFAGVYFTGFDADHDLSFEKSNLVAGEYPDYSDDDNANKIVISQQMSQSLGLGIGDKVNGCFFINEAIKSRRYEVVGIYESGFGDYDKTVVYGSISALQKVAGASAEAGTRMQIDVPTDADIETIASDLQNALINAYQSGQMQKIYPVDNVRHTGAMYFNWLELLNTNVVVIFILMICVSGFTLVSSMFIIILDRIPTIGILRALGTRRRQIRQVFMLMTMKIVGMGLIIGNVVGIGLLLLQQRYHVMTLDPQMYYLRYVPVEIDLLYFVYLNIGVVVVSWLILILPSRVASRISPSVTMRFE